MRVTANHRKASQIHPGGWIVVPAKGEGRVSRLHAVPGCRMLQITLEDGWRFEVPIGHQVLFYP